MYMYFVDSTIEDAETRNRKQLIIKTPITCVPDIIAQFAGSKWILVECRAVDGWDYPGTLTFRIPEHTAWEIAELLKDSDYSLLAGSLKYKLPTFIDSMFYVLVKVTYDYHRFQQNLACSDDLGYIEKLAYELAKTHKLPVDCYLPNGAYQAQLDAAAKEGKEKPHLWIQVMFPQVERNV